MWLMALHEGREDGGGGGHVAAPCGGRARLPGEPYWLRGAMFPLEQFPKITAWGATNKAEIVE